MCSIFGCLNYNNSVLSLEKFQQANKLMYRRGPDHSDVKEFFFSDRVLRLGHNRLSILDLSKNQIISQFIKNINLSFGCFITKN